MQSKKQNVKKFADQVFLAGALTNYEEDTPDKPKGKFDWIKFIGQLVPLIGALAGLIEVIKA